MGLSIFKKLLKVAYILNKFEDKLRKLKKTSLTCTTPCYQCDKN